jgi:hypothetical protein
MKKWIAIVLVALGVTGIAYEVWNQNSSNGLVGYTSRDSTVIDVNSWKSYMSIPVNDTDNIYEVTWAQKYGDTKTLYCMSIFKNEVTKEYKLVAPWLNALIIEDQNANDIKINKVSKKDAPDYSKNK